MSDQLLTHLVLPIANETDATVTCTELRPYIDSTVETITVVHVIEKAGGYLDKAPLEAREQQAEKVFSIIEEEFRDGPTINNELRYGTDVVDEIIATADEHDATAIVFTPQSSRWITNLLAENIAQRLITESHCPVVSFPMMDPADE
ncbi:universal stress protein [Natronoglomus mannanivorans]|uniref:Universal stress protein n=1 Tax=Natronoglomus mannanivorans TaxID=2979990 RepID=A0AAP2Z433_9EURY|nr:universal stress protein [Halobacteria archaeon AArc-xg1-1]